MLGFEVCDPKLEIWRAQSKPKDSGSLFDFLMSSWAPYLCFDDSRPSCAGPWFMVKRSSAAIFSESQIWDWSCLGRAEPQRRTFIVWVGEK